jgi:outer membrane protein
VTGVSSLPQPATVAQARIRAEKEINWRIGNPILLDKIAGLSKGLIGMKVFAVALALSLVLAAAPSFAQAPAQATAAAAGQAQPPSTAKPAPSTAKPAAPAPAVQAPAPPKVPFQTGLKYAYVQLQEVAQTSAQGKAFNAKVQALQEQKVKELESKQKQLQAAQEKLDKGASVLADAARAALQADIERLQKDIQRFTEDAQAEITALTQQLQAAFEQLLLPIIDKVAKEKQVHFVFDAAQSGLVWADPSMNLTADVIAALDAPAAKPAAAPALGPAIPVQK